MGNKRAIVKKDFPNWPEFVDNLPCRLVQKFIPIIPASWLVTGVANERFDLLGVQPERGAGGADDILFHHDRTEIIGAVLQSHLSNARPLCHP